MVRHFIIMSSSYSMGTRIAYDITDPKLWNSASITAMLEEIKALCGNDVPLSTHMVEAADASWAAVQRYDPFFETVLCMDSLREFAETIEKDRTLTGRDVAVYILSLIPCTHLSLEKLTYFAYADYLCETGKKLFSDRIYAFKYGPVVESVYERYKRNGYDYVQPDTDTAIQSDVSELPARSRILFAKNGPEKCASIDRTLARYGAFSASELVTWTHRPGSPWSQVDDSLPYEPIPDDVIRRYHQNEIPT